MLVTLQAKLIAGALGVALLLAGFLLIKGVVNERDNLRDWQKTVLVSTQKLSNNPKLIARDVPAQIDLVTAFVADLRTKLAVQNKAVDDLGQKRKDALAEAARQAALRKEVIAQSQSLAQQLRNEALTPVERENLEAELRRVQDLAWEAGL